MITCNLMGGLGNQLFQIFTTISYAMQTKKKFVFLKTDSLGIGMTTKRDTYWNNLLNKLTPFLTQQQTNSVFIRENNFRYNDVLSQIIEQTNNNVCLFGFFQSYKYFESNYNTICRLINIDKQKELILESYNTNNNLENTISIHFRLGDYKKHQNYHPIMDFEYYKKAMSYIINKDSCENNVLFFCEDEDVHDVTITINKLQLVFPNVTFSRANNLLKDWEQMLLMSCCKHNIIANSSFSWWGAYFNQNPKKIVCYPSLWFGPQAKHDTQDLCPHDWNKIN